MRVDSRLIFFLLAVFSVHPEKDTKKKEIHLWISFAVFASVAV
jgi:4-amino-4-deoxy-L-arabinose transferase-like glycosyltransferase